MINDLLDKMIQNPICELNYSKDYELLLSVVLSAQSTDKRVNFVTSILYKYDLLEIALMDIKDIEEIIKSVGTYHRKAYYIKTIANRLIKEQKGTVPNNRKYLESLPGVGHKTCNVVLYELFNVPTIAVDTHVLRVCKRLGITNELDDVISTEKKLMKLISKDKWGRTHKQLVLFGRYICKSKNPDCSKCLFVSQCKRKII